MKSHREEARRSVSWSVVTEERSCDGDSVGATLLKPRGDQALIQSVSEIIAVDHHLMNAALTIITDERTVLCIIEDVCWLESKMFVG